MSYEKVETKWFKFETAGEHLKGVLKSRQKEGKYDSLSYTLDTDDGEIKFWGTTVLNQLLEPVMDGKGIKVVYLGEKAQEKDPTKKVKKFEVFTWE